MWWVLNAHDDMVTHAKDTFDPSSPMHRPSAIVTFIAMLVIASLLLLSYPCFSHCHCFSNGYYYSHFGYSTFPCYCAASHHGKSLTRRPNPSSADTSYLPVSGFAKRLSTRSVHPRVAPDQAPENVMMRCCSVCVWNSFRRASRSSRLRLLIAASSKSQATTHALQPRLCPSRARGDLSSHWPLVQLRLLPSSTSRSQRPQWGQYNALSLQQQ